METLQAIKERRSIKHFDPEFRMPEEDVKTLLECAILSPTSFNIQNWRFLLIEDVDLRKNICEASWGQLQVFEASILLALCADLKAWNKEAGRYWGNAPKEVRDLLVPMIGPFYEGKEQLQRDEGLRSIGMVAQTLMLAAKSMGYDSCPMIGFDTDKVAALINLPDDHLLGMLLAIGKPAQKAWPRPGQLPLEEVLIKNTF